ncbi:MAG: tRNA (adenosine(37)-N6)-dimethylallyltransferase MiaA [Candidatus Pacebacteria bacterium]|nr:tRNA (adenosine(37)-N6)-dimethylallyltransferase MiaA [Candidatus Paceibacterota bacterium]
MTPKLLVILGPTASGKSDLAVEIAKLVNGEVVSADSRQVYKKLDLGTGKITKREMRGVPHHLLDVTNAKKRFSVAEYQLLATKVITAIIKRGKIPILCGGTGFYIESIVKGTVIPEVIENKSLRKKLAGKSAKELFGILSKLDPKRAEEIDAKNPVRLIRAIEIAKELGAVPRLAKESSNYEILQIGIAVDRETLLKRITARLHKRLKLGMIAESKQLHKEGLSWKRMHELGLEYRYMSEFLTNKITKSELEQEVIKGSMDYAKRQMTWWKRDKSIKWFPLEQKPKILKEVKKFLNL